MIKHQKWLPFFPILLVIIIVLVFYFTFSADALLSSILVTLIFALLLLLFFWGLFFILTRDLSKSAVITFISSLMIYLFQNLVGLLSSLSETLGFREAVQFWIQRSGQWLAFIIFVGLNFLIYLLVNNVKEIRPFLINSLNMFGIIMLLIVNVRGVIGINERNDLKESFNKYWTELQSTQLNTNSVVISVKPDIYYIIFDGFGRSDTLESIYGIDNSGFLNELSGQGFYIADKSYSNYTQTRTSLASSLNMMYLDVISTELKENTTFYYPSYLMIDESIVENTLRELGYKTVGFESEMGFLSFYDWDYYIHPPLIPDNYARSFMNNTVFSILMNQLLYNWHREEIEFALRTLPLVEKDNDPKFVFAHLLYPHPPFVYNRDGTPRMNSYLYSSADADSLVEIIDNQKYIDGYKDQVIYLQEQILKLVDQILANSPRPFIIILQGDHGPGLGFSHSELMSSDVSERLGIFNAYYFFDQNYKIMYPEISPVNSFRVIFSQYLGIDEPLLEDHHFYSEYEDLFNFTKVDDLLR